MKRTVEINVIPHHLQRYETVGDWRVCPRSGKIEIFVSDMGNPKYEMATAIHELWEVQLCLDRGITDDVVTEFDIEFENHRMPGDYSEPGDHKGAPYRSEHFSATTIERLFAAEMKIDWEDYDRAVNLL